MNFDFATAGRIVFGVGKADDLGGIAAEFGQRVFLVRGKHSEGINTLCDSIEAAGLAVTPFVVEKEPDLTCIEKGVEAVNGSRIDFIVAVGGGSVLDAGKAIAALATNPGPIEDYLEVIGRGQPLRNHPLPLIAVPTTAGTGSEVTRNAVISVPASRVKVSLRHPWMLPNVALVDPLLTVSLPPHLTASSGMDALAQVLEPYVSNRANAMVDLYCQEGLKRASSSLKMAYDQPGNMDARVNMSWASLLGGLSLANAGLGAIHGFAGPLGGLFDAPHGALCAALLVPVTKINVDTLNRHHPKHPALGRYAQIAKILTSDPEAEVEVGIRWLEELTSGLQIQGLGYYGVTSQDFGRIIEKAAVSSSMKGNPVGLSSYELTRILEMAL